MRQQLHKFAVKMLVTTHVLAFGAAFANAQPSDETTLREYAQMDAKGQKDVIFAARHEVIEDIKHKDIDRAFCIAGLFDATPEGDKQWSYLKAMLDMAVKKQSVRTADDVVEIVIKKKYCP